jgi:hypothetical protein
MSYRILSSYSPVWPSYLELKSCANKLELIANLELVANSSTQTNRPMVKLLTSGRDAEGNRARLQIPDPIPDNVVVKRSYSETGQHILLPETPNALKQAILQREVDIDEAQWFTQSFVPFLKDTGEIRMFFVGMKNIYSVHTVQDPKKRKGHWDFEYVENVTPLDIVASVFICCVLSFDTVLWQI